MNKEKKRLSILIVNNGGGGATCIVKKYCTGTFTECTKPTICPDFVIKNTNIKEHNVDLHLWDVSRIEFNITNLSCRGRDAAIIIFDISCFDSSLKNAIQWKKIIDEETLKLGKRPFPCVLVGNKADLIQEEDLPKINEKIKKVFDENNFINYFITSAKTGLNINELFDYLAKYLIENNIGSESLEGNYDHSLIKKTKALVQKNSQLENQIKTMKTENELLKRQKEEEISSLKKEYENEISLINHEKQLTLNNLSTEFNSHHQKLYQIIEEKNTKIKELQEQNSNLQKMVDLQQNDNKEIKILDEKSLEMLDKGERIGIGSCGEVFKVYMKTIYALKVMNINGINFTKIQRFIQEYEIMNMLNHPNILKTFGIFFSNETTPPSILLEYCSKNLDQVIHMKIFSNIEIIYSIYQIAQGMKYLHFNKIIHRDLKPTNILIADDGIIKISDFDISKLMTNENLSMTGGVGTNKFMAPEILNEEEYYDEKVDVYSFGILLYFMLNCGEMPKITVTQIGNGKKPDIPSEFTKFSKTLINNCLNFHSKDRPSFETIVDEIEKNNFDLIHIQESERDEVRILIEKHKRLIPPYTSYNPTLPK